MTNTPRETLMFVDDEESILEVASEFFTTKGYDILTAENGRIAADIIAEKRIDCCFTDINMPEMSGIELQARLVEQGHDLPVVFLTGHGDVSNSVAAMYMGSP